MVKDSKSLTVQTEKSLFNRLNKFMVRSNFIVQEIEIKKKQLFIFLVKYLKTKFV